MKIQFLFVFGLILASAWTDENVVGTEKVLEQDKVIGAEVKAKINLGDLKCDDENVDKKVDENVEQSENGVSASGIKQLIIWFLND